MRRIGLGVMVAAMLAAGMAEAQQRRAASAQPAAPAQAQAPAPAPAPAQAPAAEAPAAAAPAPVPAAPQRTTASFADWTVVCEARAPRRACEMTQTVQDQRQQPVAVLAVGRAAPDQPWRLVARVPVNVLLVQPARLVMEGEAAPAPVSLGFRLCIPNSCFAEAELPPAAELARLRGRPAEAPARVEWQNATGAAVAVPFSFRGFAQALEALERE